MAGSHLPLQLNRSYAMLSVRKRRGWRHCLAFAALLVAAACSQTSGASQAQTNPATPAATVPATSAAGAQTENVYAEAGPNMFSPAVRGQRSLVYVPNHGSGTVSVIDPKTYRVIDTFRTGPHPQHVVPSYDLQTLWVNNNEGGNSLTPIDPRTGKRRGPNVAVADPYNMYFTPDGKAAIVVAEAEQRLDFRDPQTMALRSSVLVDCKGINHADFSADLTYAVFTCEFSGKLVRIDMRTRKVTGYLTLLGGAVAMPQDIRLSPRGDVFYVADMMAGRRAHRGRAGPRDARGRLLEDGPGNARDLPESRRALPVRVQPRGTQPKRLRRRRRPGRRQSRRRLGDPRWGHARHGRRQRRRP